MPTFTRRSLIRYLTAPAIVRTPGLLMPIRPRQKRAAVGFGDRTIGCPDPWDDRDIDRIKPQIDYAFMSAPTHAALKELVDAAIAAAVKASLDKAIALSPADVAAKIAEGMLDPCEAGDSTFDPTKQTATVTVSVRRPDFIFDVDLSPAPKTPFAR